jgi:hypothetical protein
MVRRLAGGLFRRHVRDGPEDRADAGGAAPHFQGRLLTDGAARRPRRKPEVEDFRAASRRDDDRAGLEVAMDDACRVGVGESIRELRREIDGAAGIERPAGDDAREAFARDELEYQKQPALVFRDLVQRGDVRV